MGKAQSDICNTCNVIDFTEQMHVLQHCNVLIHDCTANHFNVMIFADGIMLKGNNKMKTFSLLG